MSQRAAGLTRQLVGVRIDGDRIIGPEHPWPVTAGTRTVGAVRAAAYSPAPGAQHRVGSDRRSPQPDGNPVDGPPPGGTQTDRIGRSSILCSPGRQATGGGRILTAG